MKKTGSRKKSQSVVMENWDGEKAYLDRNRFEVYKIDNKQYLVGEEIVGHGSGNIPLFQTFKVRNSTGYEQVLVDSENNSEIMQRLAEEKFRNLRKDYDCIDNDDRNL